MKVTNTQSGPRGINTEAGPVLLDPGQTRELDVSAAELKVAKETGWFSFDGEASEGPGGNNGPTYALKDKGAGWFVVTVDGKDATKSLRKDDLEGFEALTDEQKAAFVAENKAG